MSNFYDQERDIRDNKLFSSPESMGRYSKYELFTVEGIDVKKGLEDEKRLESENTDEGYHAVIYRPPQYFIVPAKDATFQESSMNVFDHYPGILLDFIDMAKKLEDINEEEGAKIILKFCNKYGPFNISGLYSADFGKVLEVDHDGDSYYSYDYHWVLLSKAGMEALYKGEGSSSMMYILEFANTFFPKSWGGYDNILKDIDNLHVELAYNYHCESVYYAKEEIHNLYLGFQRWFYFLENNEDPIEANYELSEYLSTNPIEVTIDYNRGWKLKWVYNNLIDALNIMILNNIIETKQRVMLCKNCEAVFIANKNTQKYCNEYCNNAARQRRHYYKYKKNNQKD